ncbi:MAG TPA: hypothetical protein VH309_05650 [Elusimicrobiota bacterium]|jgi:hypothetical protein|nr:hypothetical protein [Elusimicrobiota bacterium]
MRQILLCLAVLAAPAALAGDVPLRKPIVIPFIGFTAELKNGRVLTGWKRYTRDDFASYRLVKSEKDADPVYPETPAIYTTRQAGDTAYEDGFLTAGTWHYRVCVLSVYGDRWLSPVVTVVVTPADAKRAAPTINDFE